ncbi:MAG: hypothetical protein HC826_00135 [Rhodospirillales bacterium]|nr:hypothetical protein [Rhodospirillales bacterium]
MNIATKVPSMDDRDLTILLANSKRLIDAGTPVQQAAASELMPAIEAELASRNAAKIKEKAAALAAKRAAKAAGGTA